METKKAVVARIRPVSWKICVAGEECANYVRRVLHESGIECSEAQREPELQDPLVFSFMASPKIDTPVTASELQAIFEHDSGVEVAFDV